MNLDAFFDDGGQLLFADFEVDLIQELVTGDRTIHKAQILRDGTVEDDTADGGFHQLLLRHTVNFQRAAHLDFGVQTDDLAVIRHHRFVLVAEHLALAVFAGLVNSQVIGTQHHILRRHRHRAAIRRFQQVARRQHQEARFCLRFGRQRHVNSHLVAVEVGVKRGTHQRVQFDRAAFHQHRLERLDAQTVQRRRTVQHDRMVFDNDFQRIPHLGADTLHHFAGGFDVAGGTGFHQTLHHKRFEQLQRHLFGQTALVHLQLGTDNDNRTTGVVNALTQQVLTETTLFTFQHIRQRFQRAVVGTGDRTTAAAVVDQRVHRFLQHTLFVADDDVRRAQLQQAFQTIVAVDDPAIQIVQVGGRKTTAVQLHHGADIRRNHRHHIQNHPFGAVARQAERFHHFQPFQQARPLLTGGGFQFLFQLG